LDSPGYSLYPTSFLSIARPAGVASNCSEADIDESVLKELMAEDIRRMDEKYPR